MLVTDDKIGLICCSNEKKIEKKHQTEKFVQFLKDTFRLQPILAPTIYQNNDTIFSGIAPRRTNALMAFYEDPSVKMIFDLSGVNSANNLLTYLDRELIKEANKPFVGYSDLTVVLNAIFTKICSIGYNYQLLNLLKN